MKILSTIKNALEREAPLLLSIGGVTGFVSAAFMAAKAAPKAAQVIEEAEWESQEGTRERTFEKIKLLFPYYAPTVAMMLISGAMVLSANNINRRRYMALTELYFVGQDYLRKWQDKTLDIAGKKKFGEIQNKTNEAEPDNHPSTVLITGEDVLCFDVYSKRFFKIPSVEDLRSAINALNETMYSEGFVNVNDWYAEIGLEQTENGNEYGWSMENGKITATLGSALHETTKRPYVTIRFDSYMKPRHIYSRIMRNSL